MAPDQVLIPDLDLEDDPLSPEEQQEKQKKLERIKTLIAKSKWVLDTVSLFLALLTKRDSQRTIQSSLVKLY